MGHRELVKVLLASDFILLDNKEQRDDTTDKDLDFLTKQIGYFKIKACLVILPTLVMSSFIDSGSLRPVLALKGPAFYTFF